MNNIQKNSHKLNNLRKRTEAFLQKPPSAIKKMPSRDLKDLKNLVEELQIHQVALEMQGEELYRSQLKLEEARDRYLDLYDFAPVGYFTINKRGIILKANLAGISLLGMGRSTLLGMPFTHFIAKEDMDLFYVHRKKLLKTGDRGTCELRVVKKDDNRFYVRLESISIEDDNGDITEFRISMSDINEQKIATEALAASERQKAIILCSTIARINFCDKELKIQWANRAAGESAGLGAEELEGRHCYEIWQQRHSCCEACPVLDAIETGQPQTGEIMTPDGVSWFLSGYPAFKEDGAFLGVAAVGHDVTAQKKLEGQLRQSQKMEAIGTLAGGIAHDFNNILAIILGNAELASDDVPDGNPAKESLMEIRRASIRAKDMIKQLLAFSCKSDEENKLLNMATIIKESTKMLRRAIPTSVAFKEHISDDPCNIMGDAVQINQVAMNLISNATHAMSEKEGLLEVTLKHIILQEEKTCFERVLPPGAYIILKVRDTGEGMTPEIMDRIFEPYYTTKEVGKGTGMGLSVVHGILKRHGGGIRVKSASGRELSLRPISPHWMRRRLKKKHSKGVLKKSSLQRDDQSRSSMEKSPCPRSGGRISRPGLPPSTASINASFAFDARFG